MKRILSILLQQFSGLLFPRICHLCKDFIPNGGEVDICTECFSKIVPLTSPQCSCCGHPFESPIGSNHLCGGCITDPPPFSTARAALMFTGNTRELVHQFKYNRRVLLRTPLALLTAAHLEDFAKAYRPDIIIPVPLHLKRLKERGFNQAILLGEIFARRWGPPLSRNNLKRIRWTEPQVNLGATERAANVKGAFAVTNGIEIAGKRIFLVDDVYTTGSTAKECSQVLKRAGAEDVVVITVARGIAP